MATRTYIRIREWDKYQHYRDRNPPWVKLYRELLSSQSWVVLDDASRVLLVASILLAAEHANKIPNNPAYIQRRCFLHQRPDFSKLIEIGFLEVIEEEDSSLDASKLLASRSQPASNVLQNAIPETETETETYTQETEKEVTNHYIRGGNGKRNRTAQHERWNDNGVSIEAGLELNLAGARTGQTPRLGAGSGRVVEGKVKSIRS